MIFSVLLILPVTLLGGGKQPYLILISFDGFRWDYPQRGLTPNLERVEKQGVKALSLEPVFPSKTFPNHISTV
ncbi:MAG: alkaline phosphatase family protein, partial [Calditrichaeota bacterium]|nr:alkaline phosphatase family protein [Calditrichota bacterium]